MKSDHDVSVAFGGPIKRDRLWFFSVARDQGIHKLPVGIDFWPNLNETKWGYNYQPDRAEPRVEYKNMWKNVNARITWQATNKLKINISEDYTKTCQCYFVTATRTAEASPWKR